MANKARFYVKDPDALYESGLPENERAAISKEYAEFGEYFMIEMDFETKVGRLLPRSEWKR
jgi:hypothetical protein